MALTRKESSGISNIIADSQLQRGATFPGGNAHMNNRQFRAQRGHPIYYKQVYNKLLEQQTFNPTYRGEMWVVRVGRQFADHCEMCNRWK